MKHTIPLAASLLLALGLATASYANPFGPPGEDGPGGPGGPGGMNGPGGPGGPGMGPGGSPADRGTMVLGRLINNPKLVKEVGLTDDQVTSIRNGLFDLQVERTKLKADMEISGIQQARLLAADPIDEAALMAAVEKTGAVRTELAKSEMRGLLLVHKTLNAEQREKLRAMMHHMAQAGREGPGGRGGPDRERTRAGQQDRRGGPGGHGGDGDQRAPQGPPAGDNPPPGDGPAAE